MKIASVADVKARLSAYLRECQEGPVIGDRKGDVVDSQGRTTGCS
jgi:hypothetical protein